jgi:NAD(P)-dependent dehydrogenase (short-subunit alcohol dehydrogenase family)
VGRLAGKTAIVTGATSGMGRAIACLFAREGASIVCGGRDPERGAGVVAEIRSASGRAQFVSGDVAEPENAERLVDEARRSFGGVDLAVACAGALGLGAMSELPIEVWKRTLSVNLDAVFYLLRRALPAMRERGSGSVVLVASIAAFKGFPNHAAYCASKGALVSLVRQVAIDYGPAVRINALCPGPVDTPLIWDSAAAFPEPEKAVAAVAERTLMKRLGQPEDVARAALFLASDDSAWMTGAALTLDGGILTGA